MAHYKVKTTFERIHKMDDVLVPRRSVIVRGRSRSPNLLSLLLVVLVSSVSIAGAASSGTLSFFTDAETSAGNFFVADPIYFSVVTNSTGQTFGGARTNTDTPIVLTTSPGETSDPVQLYVRAQMTGGSDAFCNALTAVGDAPLAYEGSLLALNTGTTSIMGPWNLFVSLPDAAGVLDGDTCSLDIVYTGWNDGLPEGGGYTDIHHVPLVFVFEEATSTPSSGTSPETAPAAGAQQTDTPPTDTPVTENPPAPAGDVPEEVAAPPAPDSTTTPDTSAGDTSATTPDPTTTDTSTTPADTSATDTPPPAGDMPPQTTDAPPVPDAPTAPPDPTSPAPDAPAADAPAPDAPATP